MWPFYRLHRVALVLLLGLGSLPLSAQPELPTDFQSRLDQYQLQFLFAADSDYRPYRYQLNDYQPCDFAMRSRRERLQIRYLIEPLDTNSFMSHLPQMLASRMVTHLAKNEEESVISMHELSEEQTLDEFHADWARIFYFPPKTNFSDYEHCRMLALYKEGVAMAYVFFLFDKPPVQLDQRLLTLQFLEDLEN